MLLLNAIQKRKDLFLDKWFIKPSEIYELLSIPDSINKNSLKKRVERTYTALICTLCTEVLIMCLLFITFYTANQNARFEKILDWYLWYCLLILVIKYIQSLIMNRYMNYEHSILVFDNLNTFIEEFDNVQNVGIRKALKEFYSGFNAYGLGVYNIMFSLLNVLFVVAVLLSSEAAFHIKVYAVIFVAILSIIFAVSGKLYSIISLRIRAQLTLHKTPQQSDILKRSNIPFLWNGSTRIVIPIIGVILVANNLSVLVSLLVIVVGLLDLIWTIIESIEKYYITKKYFNELKVYFAELKLKKIINQESFDNQVKLCFPTTDILNKSKSNKSLVLSHFSPKKYSEGKGHADDISFEFLPGLHQINGRNGIGKSTFLESISLPEGILVEYSENQAAFCGKPLFEEGSNIKSHREKVTYINRKSEVKDLTIDFIEIFKDSKVIYEFLINIYSQNRHERQTDSQEKVEYSEGEKAVILILKSIENLETNNSTISSCGKILIIDEMISRIYNKKDFNLREAIIKKLLNASTHNNIVIVVDHVIDIKEAKQLVMNIEGIEFIQK